MDLDSGMSGFEVDVEGPYSVWEKRNSRELEDELTDTTQNRPSASCVKLLICSLGLGDMA